MSIGRTVDAHAPRGNREEIEAKLLEAVQRAKQCWIEAPESEREPARERFKDALHLFKNLVLYGQEPDDRQLRRVDGRI
jgi:hypothetical protein